MRNVLAATLASAACLFATSAHAGTIYDLNLTTYSGNVSSGRGTLDLNNTVSTSGTSLYSSTNKTGDILEGLTFTIGGDTFTLSSSSATATFSSGALTYLTYDSSTGDCSASLTMESGDFFGYDAFAFADSSKGEAADGLISAVLDSSSTSTGAASTAVTPEPASLVLLGTGMLAGVGVLRHRIA